MGGILQFKVLVSSKAGSKRDVVLHVVELAAFLCWCGPALRLGRRLAARLPTPLARARSRARSEHLHTVADDLGRVALVAVLVLVLARPDPALDVDLGPFLQVFAFDLGEPPEERDAMPCGRLLHFAARLVLPAVSRRYPDVGDCIAARLVPRLRISAEIADQDYLVHGSHEVLLSLKCAAPGPTRLARGR